MTVDAAIPSTLDLLGLTVDDLQENVSINDGVIYGDLKYVTDYTGFSSKADEQQGYYVALHFDVPNEDGVTYTVNGVTLDSDKVIVLIVKDNTQKVKVTASKAGNKDVTKIYRLSGLTLKPHT